MLVVVCNPGERPETREVENTLKALQLLVGGYIQKVPLYGTALDAFDVYVDEEGLYRRRRFNRMLGPHTIVGPIVVSKANAEGDQISLTLDEATRVIEALNPNKQ